MNKTVSATLLAVSLFSGGIYAQETASANEKKDLTVKAYNLFQAGDLERAIRTAEKVVELEKTSAPVDTASHANSLVNLARMKRDYFFLLKNRLKNGQVEPRQRASAVEQIRKKASEADAHYREALRSNEANGRGQTEQTADIKGELGWLLYKYVGSRQSIDESERFYTESLALNEKIRGADHKETIFVVLNMGNFYYELDNYEKSMPFFERYLQTAEKIHGKNHPDLTQALRAYANILFTTFQDAEAAEAIKKIEEIAKKPETPFKVNLDFHLRSKDSVALNSINAVTHRNESADFQKRLKLLGTTLNRSNIDSMPRFTRVPVKVTVDETGRIIEAVAEHKNENMRRKAEQEVSKWTVRPFVYNGATRKLRGYLYYSETD